MGASRFLRDARRLHQRCDQHDPPGGVARVGCLHVSIIRRQLFQPDCPVAELVEHPDNPRRGDVAAIEASIEAHGFYGNIIAQTSTHRIIAGNHRYREMRARGEETIPVMWLDVDDDEALRILLNDNASNDGAGYDDAQMFVLLKRLSDETDVGLLGTGFSDDYLARLVAQLAPTPAELSSVLPLDEGSERVCPFCHAHWKDTSSGPTRLDFPTPEEQ
jgi:hypothetical protein